MGSVTKHCANKACSLAGITVNTDRDRCLGCDRELESDVDDIMDAFQRIVGDLGDIVGNDG